MIKSPACFIILSYYLFISISGSRRATIDDVYVCKMVLISQTDTQSSRMTADLLAGSNQEGRWPPDWGGGGVF